MISQNVIFTTQLKQELYEDKTYVQYLRCCSLVSPFKIQPYDYLTKKTLPSREKKPTWQNFKRKI